MVNRAAQCHGEQRIGRPGMSKQQAVRIEVSKAEAKETKRVLEDSIAFEADPRRKARLGVIVTVLTRELRKGGSLESKSDVA